MNGLFNCHVVSWAKIAPNFFYVTNKKTSLSLSIVLCYSIMILNPYYTYFLFFSFSIFWGLLDNDKQYLAAGLKQKQKTRSCSYVMPLCHN